MTLGARALGELALGESGARAPASAAASALGYGRGYALLLEAEPFLVNQDGARGFALGAACLGQERAPRGGSPVATLRYATRAYRTTPAETYPNLDYEERLDAALSWEASIPVGEASGGVASPGDLRLANPDGALDEIVLRRAWSGRPVRLYLGLADRRRADGTTAHMPRDEFRLVRAGTVDSEPVWDEAAVSLRLRSSGELLAAPLRRARLAASGGETDGAPAPLAFGKVRNVPLVLEDAARLIYALHDGGAEAVDAVKDRGVPLTFDADTTDLDAWAPVAGRYATDLSRGRVRLGGKPEGVVTADLRGDNDGGYVDAHGEIARRIALRAGLREDQIDSVAFWRLATKNRATAGWWSDADVSGAEALDEVLASAGARWVFDRQDRLSCVRLEEPGSPVLTIRRADILALSREPTEPPAWRTRVGWRRSWRVQTGEELAGAVSASDLALWGAASRFAENRRATVRSRWRTAREVEVAGLYDEEADAQAEADRRMQLFGTPRDLLRVTLAPRALEVAGLWIGDSVTLEYPRFGLAAGAAYLVVGVAEEPALGAARLLLWGPRPPEAAEAAAASPFTKTYDPTEIGTPGDWLGMDDPGGVGIS